MIVGAILETATNGLADSQALVDSGNNNRY